MEFDQDQLHTRQQRTPSATASPRQAENCSIRPNVTRYRAPDRFDRPPATYGIRWRIPGWKRGLESASAVALPPPVGCSGIGGFPTDRETPAVGANSGAACQTAS